MSSSVLERLISVLCACLIVSIFCISTVFINKNSEFYSRNSALRYQSAAFLSGKMTLHKQLTGHEYDWSYGYGGQHSSWGLGVPLLRLPFDLLARVFGYAFFPCRILIILLLYITCYLICRRQLQFFKKLGFDALNSFVLSFSLLAVAFLSSAFFTLFMRWQAVYQEVVAYGVMVSFLLLLSLDNYFEKLTKKSLAVLCALLSFSVLIRPTIIFYLLASLFALVLFRTREMSIQKVCYGVIILAVGPTVVLLTNYLRFGSPFEWGYSLNLSAHPQNIYSLRFGYPFQHLDLITTVKELGHTLFFTPPEAIIKNAGLAAYKVKAYRFFTFYGIPYNAVTLAGLVMTIILVITLLITQRKKETHLTQSCWLSLKIYFFWGVFSFIMLFIFYLRSPTIHTRYIIDFLPAITATLWSGIFAILIGYRQFFKQSIKIDYLVSFLFFYTALLYCWMLFKLQKPTHYLPPDWIYSNLCLIYLLLVSALLGGLTYYFKLHFSSLKIYKKVIASLFFLVLTFLITIFYLSNLTVKYSVGKTYKTVFENYQNFLKRQANDRYSIVKTKYTCTPGRGYNIYSGAYIVTRFNWNKKSCEANIATNALLPKSNCYFIKYRPAIAPNAMRLFANQVRLKSYLTEFQSIDIHIEKSIVRQTFCSQKYNTEPPPISLVTVGWVPEKTLKKMAPVTLLEIGVIPSSKYALKPKESSNNISVISYSY